MKEAASDNQMMNCLICRHCQLTPDSDFSKANPIVLCAKKDEERPLLLLVCGLADPRKMGSGGDRQSRGNAAADAFLKANYDRQSMAQLMNALRRTQHGVHKRAQRLGLAGGARAARIWQNNGLEQRGNHRTWTKEQLAFLKKEFARPDWPLFNGKADRVIRERIVEEVAARGHFKSWTNIRDKCYRLFTPRGQTRQREKTRRDAQKQRQRRAANRLHREAGE